MSKLDVNARVLVVLMGSIGDVTRGLGLVRPLRQALPTGKLAWLVEPMCEPLVRLMSGLDEVIVFNRPQGVRAVPALRGALRRFAPTVTLDLQRHFKSGVFTWLSGAPRRIGFHRHEAKEFNYLFQSETIEQVGEGVSKSEHYGRFLRALGISASFDTTPLIDVPAAVPALVTSPYIAVVLGSAWQTKDWPIAGYHRLLGQILRAGRFGVVLVGDKKRRPMGAELVGAFPGASVVNLAGETTLSELVGVMRGAVAGVGPDSGPGHIAAAVGRRYVGIFGPTSPGRTAPFGSEALAVQSAVGCAPCYRKRCPGLDNLCMRLVTPEAVWEQLRIVLDSR
jgi:heptosyltransferase-1